MAHLRFQPYQNDQVQDYVSKLLKWLAQIPAVHQDKAFLLAAKIVFITQRQFESLQRQLFQRSIRRLILDAVIAKEGLPRYDHSTASRYLDGEMDASIFVGNSSSSALNSFSHVNADYFKNRGRRRLFGPEIAFWVYPQRRMRAGLDAAGNAAAQAFEETVLKTDPLLRGKRRLVVLEDFSGTGEDLSTTLELLRLAALPVSEIILAPVMITQYARERLVAECDRAATASCSYSLAYALELPHRFRCFDTPVPNPSPEPTYLDGGTPVRNLSEHIRLLSENMHNAHFAPTLPESARFGFGGLALAFAFYTNCPDNTLPLIWAFADDWKPLFRRASNYL